MTYDFFLLVAVVLLGYSSFAFAQIRGVNIGGWLVTEQWITPSVYDSVDANDEWSLCNELGKSKCLSTLQEHWKSFYTRDDFVAIQAAGLNSVRIPLGYWAVDLLPYEPYVDGQYPYLIRAVQWAQELGLSVLIDLHGAPGSQNGQENSGLDGPVLFPSNSTNSERSLKVLRNLTEEFERDVYGGVVKSIELLNEPRVSNAHFPMSTLKSFYTAGTNAVRPSATSTMNVTIQDAYYGPQYWTNYNPANVDSSQPASHLTLDTHQYYAFAPVGNLSHAMILESVCNVSQILKAESSGILPTVVGEWSLDTGNSTPTAMGDRAKRTWLRLLFEAQHAAYSPNGPGQASLGWYFWAWKQEYDIDTWSYRRGVADGYIPSDISNASQLVFPVLANGCVNASFGYEAPAQAGIAHRPQLGLYEVLGLATLWVSCCIFPS